MNVLSFFFFFFFFFWYLGSFYANLAFPFNSRLSSRSRAAVIGHSTNLKRLISLLYDRKLHFIQLTLKVLNNTTADDTLENKD